MDSWELESCQVAYFSLSSFLSFYLLFFLYTSISLPPSSYISFSLSLTFCPNLSFSFPHCCLNFSLLTFFCFPLCILSSPSLNLSILASSLPSLLYFLFTSSSLSFFISSFFYFVSSFITYSMIFFTLLF